MSIKIAFSGIGGVGGYYGGLLAGHYESSKEVEVYFIARGKNLETIREEGLQIQNQHETKQVRPVMATDRAEEAGVVDYLFCTTKSYDLDENIQQLSPMIGPQTIIIPLLNGSDITERIRALLPGNEIWYGCVYIGARLAQPGLITRFSADEYLWFGDPNGSPKRQAELLGILTAAGINASNPKDIIFRIWRKFFMISISATLTSYYNQCIGKIFDLHTEDYFRLGKELMAVAATKGIQYPDDMIEQAIEEQKRMPYDSTTSMHTDFKNHKATELETLTGFVVRNGEQAGIPVPAYKMMYEKLKAIQ